MISFTPNIVNLFFLVITIFSICVIWVYYIFNVTGIKVYRENILSTIYLLGNLCAKTFIGILSTISIIILNNTFFIFYLFHSTEFVIYKTCANHRIILDLCYRLIYS